MKVGWICINCKSWLICQPDFKASKQGDSAKNESQLLIWDNCDRTYHTYCLTPPLDGVPSTVWICVDCKKLKAEKVWKGCNKELSSKEKLTFEGHPVCSTCLKQYKSSEYCKVWMCLYRENEADSNFIGCDYCESWIHAKCDNISALQLQEMSKSEEKYMCPVCRVGRKQLKK